MDELKPVYRIEYFLDAIVNGSVNPYSPVYRLESYLAKIAGENVEIPEPIYRAEFYLAYLCGENVVLPDPIYRIEYYLASLCGIDVELPEPVYRSERWFYEWASGGGLPEEYKAVIGFKFSAATYYKITDFFLTGADTIQMSFSVNKACNVFGCYTNTSATDNYSLYASTSSGGKYLRYSDDTYNSYFPTAIIGERVDVVISPTGTSGMPTDSVIEPKTFTASVDLCIGTTAPSASSSKLDGNIWGNIVVVGRLNLVPCERIADGVLGYYDTVSKTFFAPTGSAPTSLGDK